MAVSGESRPHSLDNSAIILDQVGRPPHLDRTQSFKGGLRRQSTQYQLIESNETIRWHRHSTTIFDASIDTTLAFIPLTNATLEFTLLVYLLSTYLSLPRDASGDLPCISKTSTQFSPSSLASAQSISMLTWHSPSSHSSSGSPLLQSPSTATASMRQASGHDVCILSRPLRSICLVSGWCLRRRVRISICTCS